MRVAVARQNALGHLDPPGNGGHDQPARAGSARGPRRELSIAIERGAQVEFAPARPTRRRTWGTRT